MFRFRESWLGAVGAAALGAAVEACWAQAAATVTLNAARTWLSAFGLLAPVALVLALVVAGAWRVFGLPVMADEHGDVLPGALQSPAVASRAVAAPILGFGAALSLGVLAHFALALLASDLPVLAATALAALGAGCLLRLLAGVSLLLGSAGWVRALDARLPGAVSLGLGIAVFVGPIAYGITRGTSNGDGGFWAIFGVLARQELDLRAPALGSCIGVAAALGAWRGRPLPGPLLVASSFAAFAWLATATRLLDDEAMSLAIERGGALAKSSLRLARAAADRDHDGVARAFGAHDCDDASFAVHPGALDMPGNGIDEDCSGADDESVTLALAPVAPQQVAPPEPAPFAGDPSLQPDAGSDPEPLRPGPPPSLPPELNVLLITVDTLRHDLGFAGYPRPISANLDRLAQRSVVFDHAYSFASYTGKSIGPMLIGKYPSETNGGFFHFNRFGKDETFLQERLQAAGVRTLSVQGHWYFTPEFGIGRGFDVLDMSAKPLEQALEGDKTVTSDKLSDAAIARLSQPENTRGRFFMWVHYLDPHADYVRHDGFDFGNRGRDLYDSEVAFTDQQIGRLLDFVESSGLGQRTAIVVTSDHGEAFGEHGQWRHGYELWEALVHVPLIIHVPGVPAHHVEARRGAVDLAPTVLSLCGLPLPTGEQRLSGQSLLDDVTRPAGYVPDARPVFIDMSEGPFNEERRAVIAGDIKLIMSNGRIIGLYDLGQDPAELVDRRDDRDLVARARASFVAFQRQLRWVPVKPP